MDGKKYIIISLILIILFSCDKHNETIKSGRELITQNINVLIDSVESFDMSKIKRPEKFKNIKIEKITVGVLDSIICKNVETTNPDFFLKFKVQKEDLVNFKSNYKIMIVKVNNYDSNILFVRLSNFIIQENKASIEVKKVIGISMLHNKYYFEKENGVWIFKKKEFLSMG